MISRAGVASRRDVERMIAEGRIAVNGETVTVPMTLVTEADRIAVDGAPLPTRERTRLFLYHKPQGLVTTEKDPEGRPTVFGALPADLPRLVSVGRLDLNTEGLLLLTNDGGLARVLAHPSTGWLRRYRVRAFGEISQAQLDQLRSGIEIDGIHYGPIEAQLDREQGANNWLTLGLREGKNREVKRVLEHFGLQVNRLIRISFGPFQLGDLETGTVEEVRSRILRSQLGPALAEKAGVDFSGAAPDEGAPVTAEPRRPARPDGPERPSRADPGHGTREERALRKERAVAQGRRLASHRHSWRDAESWAMGGRKHKAKAEGPRRGKPGEAPAADQRPHQRGGRIADRKGHSVLVERVVRDPAPASSEPRAPRPQRYGAAPSTRAGDVLRRRPRSPEERSPHRPWRKHDGTHTAEDRAAGRRDNISRREPRGAPHGPRGDRPFRPSSDRAGSPRGDRPFRPRDDRPRAPGDDRPVRPRDDRTRNPTGDRPRGARGDKPFRPSSDRAGSPRGDGPFRPRGDRPRASGDDRPVRPRDDRTRDPTGDRPRGARGDKPFRPSGDSPRGPRADKPFRSSGDQPRGPRGDKPFRPSGDRPRGPRGDKPFRPSGDRPRGPRGDKPFRPSGDRPRGPRGDKPFRPTGDRPRGPRGKPRRD